MRIRILIGAAVVAGSWLGACSKPAPQSAQEADPNGARHILLAEPARLDSVVVSALEASHAAHTHPTSMTRKNREPTPSLAPAKGNRSLPAVVAEGPMRGMSMTASSMAPALRSVDLAPVPQARTVPGEVVRGSEGGFLAGNDGEYPVRGSVGAWPGGVGRGPSIIIRGGMGSPDDDCDLRNMHPRGAGAAVNRAAPAFGGSRTGRGGATVYPRGIR